MRHDFIYEINKAINGENGGLTDLYVTINSKGLIIKGNLISADEYLSLIRENKSINEINKSSLNSIFRNVEKKEEEENRICEYVHLSNAEIMYNNVKENIGMWFCHIDDVDGFSFKEKRKNPKNYGVVWR
ncbi:MAG: hypothetical protein C0604_10365 [Clostridiales bacterium]|nr:MAG: hypothetical protein C0604_10365 [Clostridiales bacterium]